MGFRQRLGTALRNINDIQTFGYPKENERQQLNEKHEDDKENPSVNLDDEVIGVSDSFDGWDISVGKPFVDQI